MNVCMRDDAKGKHSMSKGRVACRGGEERGGEEWGGEESDGEERTLFRREWGGEWEGEGKEEGEGKGEGEEE